MAILYYLINNNVVFDRALAYIQSVVELIDLGRVPDFTPSL